MLTATTIGLDIAKSVTLVHGIDAADQGRDDCARQYARADGMGGHGEGRALPRAAGSCEVVVGNDQGIAPATT